MNIVEDLWSDEATLQQSVVFFGDFEITLLLQKGNVS